MRRRHFSGSRAVWNTAIDAHLVIRSLVEDGVRKPPDECAAIVFVHYRVHPGPTPDLFHARVDRAEKFLAEASPAAFVPVIRFRNIRFRLCGDHQISGHSSPERGASPHPSAIPMRGFLSGSLSFGQAPASASRAPEHHRVPPRCRPTNLPPAGAFLNYLDRKSRQRSFVSPGSCSFIVANCLALLTMITAGPDRLY